MSVTPLFTDRYLDIGFDARGWLHADWKGYQTVGTVQQGCERILELMREQGTRRVLNDNTNVVGIWSGAAEWVATDWFPRMREGGLTHFAWVYSPSRFSQVSTDETLESMDPAAAGVRTFGAVDDAREWLMASPVTVG